MSELEAIRNMVHLDSDEKRRNNGIKAHFYKNIAKTPIVTQNLHDPASIFQANTHQNTGHNCANFV